jgi:hypothetical protein
MAKGLNTSLLLTIVAASGCHGMAASEIPSPIP